MKMTNRESDGLLVVRGVLEVRLFDGDGQLKFEEEVHNAVTTVGDQYYAERAAGIGTPPNQVTGMRLGTGGGTAVAKSGAGSFIAAYVSGSAVAITGGYPQSAAQGAGRRIIWRATWAAGVATSNGINEVVLTNENPLTNVVGTAANTIARAIISPAVDKAAADTLEITWNHDILGALA